jgi:hypothetical protein
MAKTRKSSEAVNTIDVRGVGDEDLKVLNEFPDSLRRKSSRRTAAMAKEDTRFANWPPGVKGSLTRREIYDHL